MAILDLNENVKEKSSQIKSVCKRMELSILRKGKNKSNSIEIMAFKRPEFRNQERKWFKDDIKDKELKKSWQFLKDTGAKYLNERNYKKKLIQCQQDLNQDLENQNNQSFFLSKFIREQHKPLTI